MWFNFRWIAWNFAKIEKHGLSTEEVEYVITRAVRPYPRPIGNDKWETVGATRHGRWIQVVHLVDDDDALFVIHARPLTQKERQRHHRGRRGSP